MVFAPTRSCYGGLGLGTRMYARTGNGRNQYHTQSYFILGSTFISIYHFLPIIIHSSNNKIDDHGCMVRKGALEPMKVYE